ncbi:MAG TPA: hypothetical protein VGG29_14740 [Caulobacteraceae bacterium]
MQHRRAGLGWLAILSVVAVAACHRAQPEPPAAAAAPQPRSVAAGDAGASALADIDNARAALAAGDEVAALNDVNQALGFAVSLPDTTSNVYPADAETSDDSGGGGEGGGGGHRHGHGGGRGGGHGGHGGGRGGDHRGGSPAPPVAQAAGPPPAAPKPATAAHTRAGPPALTAFDLQVRLTTAQAKLEMHDARGADAVLAAIRAGTPARLVPADLPLVRADESLALALTAISTERASELRTQLANAAAALAAYGGASHSAGARSAGAHSAEALALAATIDAAARSPSALTSVRPDLVSSWMDRIDGCG